MRSSSLHWRHQKKKSLLFVAIVSVGLGLLLPLFTAYCAAQGAQLRTFSQSKAMVEKTLQKMQGSLGGRLPGLEGFATSVDHALSQYQRAYYQTTVQVTATPSGGSIVRASAKVTAWYNDSAGSHSGYQLLTSNGRLEADLLDQLSDALGGTPTDAKITNKSAPAAGRSSPSEPTISAPVPRLPDIGGTFSSSLAQSLATRSAEPDPSSKVRSEPSALQTEADSLQEVLKNQSHPRNLVAVKKSGTPVVPNPSLNAKPQFLASAHDEFEMLDFNANWVHVRISGLSRGWIWRNSLEMPESIPDTEVPTGPAPPAATELFHVSREETAQFPGDWEPLRGKSVKIISVEKIDENAKDSGPRMRLEFAKSLLDKNLVELTAKPQDVAGVVLIFDSADGGMIAATLTTLQQWKAGKLTDAALWHQCFFDPPEILNSSAESSASQ